MEREGGAVELTGGLPRMPFQWEDPRIYAAHLSAHYQQTRRVGVVDIEGAAAQLLDLVGLPAGHPLYVAAERVARAARHRPAEQALLLTDGTRSQMLMRNRVYPPEYHNPFHAFEVACNVGILLSVGRDLSPHFGALAVVAALGHDLCHDGSSNLRPFHLEGRAVMAMRALLHESGVDTEDRLRLEALIYATDVAAARPTLAALAAQTEPPAPVPFELTGLLLDPTLARVAFVLVDADVLCSAGLTWEMHRVQSEALGREWRKDMGASEAVFFLDVVLGGRFLSTGGRYFMPNLEGILRRAHAEVHRGE